MRSFIYHLLSRSHNFLLESKPCLAFRKRETKNWKVNFQERDQPRRRGVRNLFEGSLLALEKRKLLVSCPFSAAGREAEAAALLTATASTRLRKDGC